MRPPPGSSALLSRNLLAALCHAAAAGCQISSSMTPLAQQDDHWEPVFAVPIASLLLWQGLDCAVNPSDSTARLALGEASLPQHRSVGGDAHHPPHPEDHLVEHSHTDSSLLPQRECATALGEIYEASPQRCADAASL